jgi:O-antigen/teichoic acid export membrane protein
VVLQLIKNKGRNSNIYFFVCSSIAAGLNFLFQILMSHSLEPYKYGALGSLIGVITITSIMTSSLQTVITKSVIDGINLENQPLHEVEFRKLFLNFFLVAILFFVTILLSTNQIKNYLHLNSQSLIFMLGGYIAFSLLTIIPQGILAAELKFKIIANSLIVNSAFRLSLGFLSVKSRYGISGAMLAILLGSICQFLILLFPFKANLVKNSIRAKKLFNAKSAFLTLFSLFGIAAFTGIDSVLARHYLSKMNSGIYIAASTGAKSSLFVTAAVISMSFVYFSKNALNNQKLRELLKINISVVFLIGAVITIIIEFFAQDLVKIAFGSNYQNSEKMLRILAISSFEFALSSLLTYFFIAKNSIMSLMNWISVLIVLCAIHVFHNGPFVISMCVLFSSSVTLLVQLVGLIVIFYRLKF